MNVTEEPLHDPQYAQCISSFPLRSGKQKAQYLWGLLAPENGLLNNLGWGQMGLLQQAAAAPLPEGQRQQLVPQQQPFAPQQQQQQQQQLMMGCLAFPNSLPPGVCASRLAAPLPGTEHTTAASTGAPASLPSTHLGAAASLFHHQIQAMPFAHVPGGANALPPPLMPPHPLPAPNLAAAAIAAAPAPSAPPPPAPLPPYTPIPSAAHAAASISPPLPGTSPPPLPPYTPAFSAARTAASIEPPLPLTSPPPLPPYTPAFSAARWRHAQQPHAGATPGTGEICKTEDMDIRRLHCRTLIWLWNINLAVRDDNLAVWDINLAVWDINLAVWDSAVAVCLLTTQSFSEVG